LGVCVGLVCVVWDGFVLYVLVVIFRSMVGWVGLADDVEVVDFELLGEVVDVGGLYDGVVLFGVGVFDEVYGGVVFV